MTAKLLIARGTSEHLQAVLGLIDEASHWLPSKGTDQWAQPWPDRIQRDARVRRALEVGATWIVWARDRPVATVTVSATPNIAIWSESECDLSVPAIYADRVLVARDFAGWGLGAELLDWTGLRAHREYGAQWIRINVWTTNRALHGYFIKRGFEPCGICPDPEYPSGVLFQKLVSRIAEPTSPLFEEPPAESVFFQNENMDQQEKFGVALIDGTLRMISIQADGHVRFLDPFSQPHSLLYIASIGAYERKALIDELEALINLKNVPESQLQDFFERNPEFLCGDIYESAHPHIVLQRPEVGPLIPDFALKPCNAAALCDLLELKLPNAKLVVGPDNRRRLSQAVMDACAQLREYRNYFDLPSNRKATKEAYGLRFFQPRMMVVIGRRDDYLANDLRKAESDVPNLTITTYDDLLERARNRMRLAKGRQYRHEQD